MNGLPASAGGTLPVISVIVACYNVEQYLSRCLDSIAAQTYPALEVWLIDDGARDNTGRICDHYAREDERFHVVHQDNGGLADARNEGMARATGDFIAFVDGDDYLEPRMYEYLMTALLETESDVAICPYLSEPDDRPEQTAGQEPGTQRTGALHLALGTAVVPHYLEIPSRVDLYELEPPELLTVYIEERDEMPIQNAAWNKLYRRELIGSHRFPNQRYYEDMVFQTKVLAAARRAVFVDIQLYHYIINRKDSIMGAGLREEILTEQIPSYRQKDEFLQSIGRRDLVDSHDYLVYKKLLILYTQARRDRTGEKSRFKAPLMEVLGELREDYPRIAASPIADPHQLLRMRLYLRGPWWFDRFTDLNEGLVLPLRRRLRGSN